MKKFIWTILLILSFNFIEAQIPKSGTYIYKISFAESNGKLTGAKCKVIIDNNKIKIINIGEKLSGKKGEVITEGIIMKHKSGKWIIGKDKKDKNAKEIGGCTNGPIEIDFKNMIIWLC